MSVVEGEKFCLISIDMGHLPVKFAKWRQSLNWPQRPRLIIAGNRIECSIHHSAAGRGKTSWRLLASVNLFSLLLKSLLRRRKQHLLSTLIRLLSARQRTVELFLSIGKSWILPFTHRSAFGLVFYPRSLGGRAAAWIALWERIDRQTDRKTYRPTDASDNKKLFDDGGGVSKMPITIHNIIRNERTQENRFHQKQDRNGFIFYVSAKIRKSAWNRLH